MFLVIAYMVIIFFGCYLTENANKNHIQVLPKEDMETLDLCKNMMERGEWPPLMVVFDPREG